MKITVDNDQILFQDTFCRVVIPNDFILVDEKDCQDCKKLINGYDHETRKKNMKRCKYCSEYPLYQVINRMTTALNIKSKYCYQMPEVVKLFQAHMILRRLINQTNEYS